MDSSQFRGFICTCTDTRVSRKRHSLRFSKDQKWTNVASSRCEPFWKREEEEICHDAGIFKNGCDNIVGSSLLRLVNHRGYTRNFFYEFKLGKCVVKAAESASSAFRQAYVNVSTV